MNGVKSKDTEGQHIKYNPDATRQWLTNNLSKVPNDNPLLKIAGPKIAAGKEENKGKDKKISDFQNNAYTFGVKVRCVECDRTPALFPIAWGREATLAIWCVHGGWEVKG